MDERPDYVPRLWVLWGLNRWMASEPRRVLIWFIVAPVLGVLLSISLMLAGAAGWWLALVGSAALLAQALVYLPRAYRATRVRGHTRPGS
jgi:hypothetical protein